MNAKRFTFMRQDSTLITGVVQGCGGAVTSQGTLHVSAERARNGEQLGIYEPEPGCVLIFPDYSAAGNGDGVVLSLLTSTLLGDNAARLHGVAQ